MENEGWSAAVKMLQFERIAIGTAPRKQSSTLSTSNLVEIATKNNRLADALIRNDLAKLSIEERAVSLLAAQFYEELRAGIEIGARGSVAKLAGAALERRAADLAVRASGHDAVGWGPEDQCAVEIAKAVNSAPASGTAGGTNEIQRNIIGERVLGLPHEPIRDRTIPFREFRVGTQRVSTGTSSRRGSGS